MNPGPEMFTQSDATSHAWMRRSEGLLSQSVESPDDAFSASPNEGALSDEWRSQSVGLAFSPLNSPGTPCPASEDGWVQPIRTECGYSQVSAWMGRCPHNRTVRFVGSNPQIRQDFTKSTQANRCCPWTQDLMRRIRHGWGSKLTPFRTARHTLEADGVLSRSHGLWLRCHGRLILRS